MFKNGTWYRIDFPDSAHQKDGQYFSNLQTLIAYFSPCVANTILLVQIQILLMGRKIIANDLNLEIFKFVPGSLGNIIFIAIQ